MDTVINDYLIKHGGLKPTESAIVGYCVESRCTFTESVAFPDLVRCGLRVGKAYPDPVSTRECTDVGPFPIAKLGNSSVRYEVGFFKQGCTTSIANGHFVHVFVDKSTNRPVSIPSPIRGALNTILVH